MFTNESNKLIVVEEVGNGPPSIKGEKSLLVLPLAALIETGNHIAHISGDRYAFAKDLSEIIVKVATAEEPWAAFTSQSELWSEENLKKLADEWPKLAAEKLSIGNINSIS